MKRYQVYYDININGNLEGYIMNVYGSDIFNKSRAISAFIKNKPDNAIFRCVKVI